jgi:hypothetical protein
VKKPNKKQETFRKTQKKSSFFVSLSIMKKEGKDGYTEA